MTSREECKVLERKIVICFRDFFPRHGAGANYVEYLALALAQGGAKVYIIAQLNSEFADEFEKQGDYYLYKGVYIFPFRFHSDKLRHYMDYHYFLGKMIERNIRKLDLTYRDWIICYTQERNIFKAVFRMRKENGCKIANCVVEWYDAAWFASNKQYARYSYDFETLLPKFDLLLPISKYINEYFAAKVKKSLVLPIMANTDEYKYQTREKTNSFIIPAHGRMKDSLGIMLQSFVLLVDYTAESWHLHLCGVSETDILKYLAREDWDKIKTHVVFHTWMKYNDLIALYQRMDFLLLARGTSHMTLANFPSKVPEAMTHGVIPIVSKVGDYTEDYLCEKNAFIFEPCSVSKCLEQLLKAINLSAKQYQEMSLEARKCAETKFDYHNWVTILSDTMEDVNA